MLMRKIKKKNKKELIKKAKGEEAAKEVDRHKDIQLEVEQEFWEGIHEGWEEIMLYSWNSHR